MILQLAINFVVSSDQFKTITANAGINVNFCFKVEAKVVNVNANQIMAIEIRFDFGQKGPDSKDVLARVFVDTNSEIFSLHSIASEPWFS